MIFAPPTLDMLEKGTKLKAGLGETTILADMDFETYSEAGFVWNETENKFEGLPGATEKGIFAVGAAAYAEHPTCEVLSLAYDLKDGYGKRLWKPDDSPPLDLFKHIESKQLIEAWNVSFEYWIWTYVCVPKYNFPPLSLDQLRCAAAKARAFGLPGSLEAAGDVLNINAKKDKDGKRLLNKFSIPRKPTLKDKRRRIKPHEDSIDAEKLYQYNIRDIEAEAELSSLIPDLTPAELEFWKVDQLINRRGVAVDIESVKSCIKIVESAHAKYNQRLFELTNGQVKSASEILKMRDFILKRGVVVENLNAETIEILLKNSFLMPPDVYEILKIRQTIGSAAVKKLYAMMNRSMRGRLHDLFIYHSARTGRAAGAGVQPQNMPNSGMDVYLCEGCENYYGNPLLKKCPYCHCEIKKKYEWNQEAVHSALDSIKSNNLEFVEEVWGDAIEAVSGCLRGLIVASKNHDLICSDYSAIEAVVLAALAEEEWRLDVFRTHGKIYEMSASKITGVPFEEFERYKQETDQHHPMRKKVGKVAELASGYQGWIGAWKNFGADEFFNDDEIKKSILSWREASPAIVEMWGGQTRRGYIKENFGLEGAAVNAILFPGKEFKFKSISYLVRQNVLYCRLPSGRHLVYHRPRLTPSDRRHGTYSISFEGWNTNPKNGGIGWIRMETYGGKLTENVVQATARDILAHAIINLEKAGYKVVLHVHDEIVAEVPENWGSIKEFEAIMSTLPDWAKNWPLKAKDGWRAKRYGK